MQENYKFIESELLSFIPLCTIANPSNVLLFDSFNLEIASLCLEQGVALDMIQNDTKKLESMQDSKQVLTHKNFNLYKQAIDLDIKKYDVIIADSTLNKHKIDGLSRMLSKQGVLVAKNANPLENENEFIEQVAIYSEFFSVVMPFFSIIPTSYIFASKQTHPTADMILHKIDLLECKYYNAKIHESCFTMPTFLANKLDSIIKC